MQPLEGLLAPRQAGWAEPSVCRPGAWQDLLQAVLRFCYTGECSVARGSVLELLLLADRFAVPALQAACEEARPYHSWNRQGPLPLVLASCVRDHSSLMDVHCQQGACANWPSRCASSQVGSMQTGLASITFQFAPGSLVSR